MDREWGEEERKNGEKIPFNFSLKIKHNPKQTGLFYRQHFMLLQRHLCTCPSFCRNSSVVMLCTSQKNLFLNSS